MARSLRQLSLCRWRGMRLLAMLAWIAMAAMPVMMPAHAGAMSVGHGSGAMHAAAGAAHSTTAASCCEGAPSQPAGNHGCQCAVTCSAGVVLPGSALIVSLAPAHPSWPAMEQARPARSPTPPYRPPRV